MRRNKSGPSAFYSNLLQNDLQNGLPRNLVSHRSITWQKMSLSL